MFVVDESLTRWGMTFVMFCVMLPIQSSFIPTRLSANVCLMHCRCFDNTECLLQNIRVAIKGFKLIFVVGFGANCRNHLSFCGVMHAR